MYETELNQTQSLKSGVSKANIPQREIDFMAVAKNIQKHWSESELSLIWANPDDLSAKIVDFDSAQLEIRGLVAQRRLVVDAMRKINEETDKALSQVKSAVRAKYGSESYGAYITQLGFKHTAKGYLFPTNTEGRIVALGSLVSNSEVLGLALYSFDAAYWQAMLEKLKTKWEESRQLTAQISKAVIRKDTAKHSIRKILNNVVGLLKVNYPDNYKRVLRSWEVQKERF